jgi:sortase (surface protein transpeptidase)
VRVRAGFVAAAILAAAGAMMIAFATPRGRPPEPARRPAAQSPVASSSAPHRPLALDRSEPVYLDVPAIGVHTPLVGLGLNADGTIALPPPRRNAPAGWYRYLPTPGEIGPAVIVGHLDSARYGPAVFFRLASLRTGDTVSVRRADGSTAVFSVVALAEYPKTSFPTDTVYGPVDYPALRLITCGGSFDQAHHRYRANIVAYAVLVAAHRPAPRDNPGDVHGTA